MAFKFNITNVCKDCLREIPFDINTNDALGNDFEFEVQSGMCEYCLKEKIKEELKSIRIDKAIDELKIGIHKTIQKTIKKIGD